MRPCTRSLAPEETRSLLLNAIASGAPFATRRVELSKSGVPISHTGHEAPAAVAFQWIWCDKIGFERSFGKFVHTLKGSALLAR